MLSTDDVKRMAHLVFLTSTPPTIAEGSGTWVGISVLRDALLRLGHEVTLVAPTPGAARATTLSRVVFNLRARSGLRQVKADAVIGFDLDGVFVRRNGPIHVAAIKGVIADEAKHERGGRRLALAIQARLEATNVRRADCVITTSRYSAEQISRRYGVEREKILVVPELIDVDGWQKALRNAATEEGEARILCVAHLYPRKRVDTLLRSFARVQRKAVLRIVGIGPERHRLEQLAHNLGIDDRVVFLGHVPFHGLISEYRNASVFALPTEQEGFGIVFLEAMASSLPVIAARAGAVPEVVAEGSTAKLVDPGDEVELAAGLERLLDEPSMRVEMGRQGWERVRRYDAPVVARQFLAAIAIQDVRPHPATHDSGELRAQ